MFSPEFQELVGILMQFNVPHDDIRTTLSCYPGEPPLAPESVDVWLFMPCGCKFLINMSRGDSPIDRDVIYRELRARCQNLITDHPPKGSARVHNRKNR